MKPRALIAIRQHSFPHRVVNNWNELLEDVVLSDSLNWFKNKLEDCFMHKAAKYEITFKYD